MTQSWQSLFEEHRALPRKMAGQYKKALPACVDIDDLEQCGLIGLMRAAKSFDPSKGVKFPKYASSRIFGCMKDGIRSMDWVPRTARKSDENPVGMISMETVLSEGDTRDQLLLHTIGYADPEPEFETLELFERAMGAVSKVQRKVVEAYYLKNLPMRVIGESMGVSIERVRQILVESKDRMRRRLCA